MGVKRDAENSIPNIKGVESESDFDAHLKSEIARAKQIQISKDRNKKRKLDGNAIKRDSSGFRVKAVDAGKKRNIQVDPDYEVLIEGPLRKIKPYYFTYKTFCKERWRDRKLLDVFVSEFRDRDEQYYRKTIAKGDVFLNDTPANLESIIRNGDLITHKLHRHEPAVTSEPVKTVFENEDILVIDKPSGVPVHPTGRYRFNSVTKILERDLKYTVHPVNRLDRLTSGLMFMAKTPKGADELGDQLKAREVSKEYIARVVGEFPIEEIVVDKPLKTVDPKVALNRTCTMEDEGARHAKTVFNRISYDGKTSIVKCKPLTGRQHQIRVHLQYLGHPIANDPIYSNVSIWGDSLGKGGNADYEEVRKKLYDVGRTVPAQSWFYPESEGEILREEKCPECETDLYTDPNPAGLILWLHSYRYESKLSNDGSDEKKWSYRTQFPKWALEPHKKYMELAIQEAQKCGPTTTAFSVGAVLVHGTEILSTGYSRELEGNTHAEQCAMEKYFTKTGKRDLPVGTVLYTTMEPCSFRLSGNEPCVQRIIDLDGKIQTVFVGVMEPDTFVKNNTSLSLLEDKNINYIQIPGYEEECTKAAVKGHPEEAA